MKVQCNRMAISGRPLEKLIVAHSTIKLGNKLHVPCGILRHDQKFQKESKSMIVMKVEESFLIVFRFNNFTMNTYLYNVLAKIDIYKKNETVTKIQLL